MYFKNIQRVTEKRFVQELHNHSSKTYRKINAAIPLNWFLFVCVIAVPLFSLLKSLCIGQQGGVPVVLPSLVKEDCLFFHAFPTSNFYLLLTFFFSFNFFRNRVSQCSAG